MSEETAKELADLAINLCCFFPLLTIENACREVSADNAQAALVLAECMDRPEAILDSV